MYSVSLNLKRCDWNLILRVNRPWPATCSCLCASQYFSEKYTICFITTKGSVADPDPGPGGDPISILVLKLTKSFHAGSHLDNGPFLFGYEYGTKKVGVWQNLDPQLYGVSLSGLGNRSLVFCATRSFKKSESLFQKEQIALVVVQWKWKDRSAHFALFALVFFNERQERKSEFPALAQVLWIMGLIWPQSISKAWALKLEFFSRNGAWSLVEGPTSVGLSRNLIVFVFSGKNFKNLYFHFIKKYDEIQKKCCSPWKCKRYNNLARIFSYRFLALPPLTAALLWVPQLCFIEDLWVKTNDKTRKHRLLEERI